MTIASSESEGEIFESDRDNKATATTLAQPASNGTSVNRRLREALSRSPSPSRASSTFRSPTPRDSSRSISPQPRSTSPHGEKRKRPFEDASSHSRHRQRLDPRQFKVHYERDSRSDDRHRRKDYDAHRLNDRTNQRSSRYERDDRDAGRHGRGGQGKRTHDRSQSRSRSPARNGRGYEHETRQRDPRASESRRPAPSSVSDNERAPSITHSRRDYEAKSNVFEPQSDTFSPADDQSVSMSDRTVRFTMDTKAAELQNPPPEKEVISIEERRRRREAIKAKYKSQAPPLLVQALSSTVGNTPQQSRSVSPAASSPDSSGLASSSAMPEGLSVSSDAELANNVAAGTPGTPGTPEAGDSPAAADYNPTMDMEEDMLKATHRHQSESAKPDPEDVKDATEAIKKSAGDDMFASDDDDDMFAPVAPDKLVALKASGDAPQAKELDQSLLDNWDDPEGYYRFISGELLDGRYSVQANLGRGMFSSVVRAMDSVSGNPVAIKIIRNNETMLKAGTKEMEILQRLAAADPDDKKHVIRLERSFIHKQHLCMVFENLSINLREVLKKFGRDVGINLKAVRSYAQQMFLGLSLLRKCNILHADLKPDNILVNEGRNMLKVCDLGSAADASQNDITPYLVSRFYRAPEIILGVPYDFAIDMWSIGCTLFELYTGKILFTGRTNNQMLKSMMECRGKFSLKMLKRAEFAGDHFDSVTLDFRSVERDRVTGRDVTKLINYVRPVKDLKTRLMATALAASHSTTAHTSKTRTLNESDQREVTLFADLLDRCLALNPEKRITPLEALRHPFIARDKSASIGR